MRTLVTALMVIGVGFSNAGPVHGQARTEAWHAEASAALQAGAAMAGSVAFSGEAAGVAADPTSFERVLTGTTIGAVAGGAFGLAAVATVRGKRRDGDMFPWLDLAAGTVLGSAAGMWLGAQMSSGGQGNAGLTGLAAVGGTALGLLVGFGVGDALAGAGTGKAPEILGIALAVSIPLALTSYAEWRAAQ